MKNKISLIIAIGVLTFIAMACSGSFTTANINSLNFGKNEKAEPPTTSFDLGDKIYAVANIANTSSKHKMKFKVTNQGKEVLAKDVDFEGSKSVFLNLSVSAPGDYNIEAVLLDESGKEIDKKSGTISVKGSAPAAPTEKPKDSDKDDKDSDDKDSDDK